MSITPAARAGRVSRSGKAWVVIAAPLPARDAAVRPGAGFAVEPTAIGLQSLVPGVMPIGAAQRLAARAAAPLEPKKPQRPCDLGLFDMNARLQLDLFQPKDV